MTLAQNFPHIVNRVAGEMVTLKSRLLQDFDLNLRTWQVLVALGERDGQRVTDLSDAALTEISTLSRLLDDMEQQGFVEKRRARPNARSVTVHITTAGRSLLTATLPEALRYEDALCDGIDDEDLATTRRVLNKLHENALMYNL